ncbi:uncharacterized protein LOC133331354 isoform X2 [Musca vetustissima]|uniref:uncharacterized protein LOC133331354 isoform X2 n=1 Tax=Musca vetustissima TaxID=27455 RepID=UPI002AB6921F|nr:uncharacterized protein LOC133331354 isoform X2 [Musca vetustissima]
MEETPRKIKRFSSIINNDGLNQKCNCETFVKKMENVENTQKVIQGQIKVLADALAELKVMVQKLLRSQSDEIPLTNRFPISTEKDLIDINNDITSENKDLYIISSIIKREGILKSLKNIIGLKITYEYNIDGNHGKKSLKSLSNIYNVILDSIPVQENSDTPETQLRKAIQVQKKRFFKQVSAERKAE